MEMSPTTGPRDLPRDLHRDLPRSRALVVRDGPGHVMPVEPVTPAGSRAWHVVHLPAVLAAVATGLLVATAAAVRLLGFRFAAHVPGARFALVLAGAALGLWAYWAFGRFVERRPRLEELGTDGAGRELGLAWLGGLGMPLALFAILQLAGVLHVAGFNPPGTLLTPLVVQFCVTAVLVLAAGGLAFRLVERWLGSWLAVALATAAFAGARLLTGDAAGAGAGADALAGALGALLLVSPFMATRRLWAAIGLRTGWKVGTVALEGTALSARGPKGLVLAYVSGPDWLTGGWAGLDASVPALAIGALVAAVLLTLAIRRGRIVRPAWQRGRGRA